MHIIDINYVYEYIIIIMIMCMRGALFIIIIIVVVTRHAAAPSDAQATINHICALPRCQNVVVVTAETVERVLAIIHRII